MTQSPYSVADSGPALSVVQPDAHATLDLPVPAEPPKVVPPPPSLLKSAALRVWNFCCEQWFIIGLGFATGLAAAIPDLGRTGGYIRSEYTVKYCCVIIIFLLSGMSLKTRALLSAATALPMHGAVQGISLGLIPVIGWGIATGLSQTSLNRDLVDGLVVCLSMPTTASTNVVFTKQANGNEALALVNAVVGNIIGIFISPALLMAYLGRSSQAPYAAVLTTLAGTVIGPLVAGQIVQYLAPGAVKWLQAHLNFAKTGSTMILLLVWATFSSTFASKVEADAGSVIALLVICAALYLIFTVGCLAFMDAPPVKRALKTNRGDAIAVAMCAATKTVALGIPLISVIYASSPKAGILAVPLLMYHALQILLGAVIIPPLRRWRDAEVKPAPAASAPAGTEAAEAGEAGEAAVPSAAGGAAVAADAADTR